MPDLVKVNVAMFADAADDWSGGPEAEIDFTGMQIQRLCNWLTIALKQEPSSVGEQLFGFVQEAVKEQGWQTGFLDATLGREYQSPFLTNDPTHALYRKGYDRGWADGWGPKEVA